MIPIFIICKDRCSCLKQCLIGYKKLMDVEIIIHDNNSTYPPMVKYLEELEEEGIKVVRHPNATNEMTDISKSVDITIEEWYKSNDSSHYVVTDPDIELENPTPELLSYYIYLQQHFGVDVVGPMLRIDDLPTCFNVKDEMVASHMIQFWGPSRDRYCQVEKGFKIQFCAIDTTFGVYPKSFRFRRLNRGIRVYEPFMARHLDWYLDTSNLDEEQQYYVDHCNKKVSTLSSHITRGGMK